MTDDENLRLRWQDFPSDEYSARTERAQERMARDGLDALILTQQQNVEYFSGFLNGHWVSRTFPTAVVIIPARRDPILVLPDFFDGTAHATSWIDDRRLVGEPHANPRGFGPTIVAAIEDVVGSTATIGLEQGSHLVPGWNLDDLGHVTDTLSGATFARGGGPIWSTRMIKSGREIERMQWLTSVTDQSITEVRDRLEVGMTEIEIASEIQIGMVRRGADGAAFRNVRAGADRYACSDSLPQDRPIADGDMLLIDTGATYNSYTTDVAYVTHIGAATSAHRQSYDTIVKAHDAALDVARPGVAAREVFLASLRILEDSPLRTLDMCGHGIGMEIHEPPMLTPYDETPLEPGMTFAVEPWLYDTEGLGLFCVEEIVHITEDGAEVLSSIARDELHELV